MKRCRCLIGVAAIVAFVSLAAGGAVAAALRPEIETSQVEWSPIVRGVQGRLIATPSKDDLGRAQLQLELELENRSETALPIWWSGWSAMLVLSLEDESGKALLDPVLRRAGNEIVHLPYWVRLLPNSSMRILITKQAFSYAKPGRILLEGPGFREWEIPETRTGTLHLRATLAPKAAPEPPNVHAPNDVPWIGPLTTPRVVLP